jgi:hypothetical protein
MTFLLDMSVIVAAVALLFVWLDWPEREDRDY